MGASPSRPIPPREEIPAPGARTRFKLKRRAARRGHAGRPEDVPSGTAVRVELDAARGWSVPRDHSDVSLECTCLEDVGDLLDHEPDLIGAVVVVRAVPNARVRPEVAEDLPLHQLAVHR